MVRREQFGVRRTHAFAALVALGAALLATTAGPSSADVTTLQGSAFGASAQDVTIFGGAQTPYGPKPTVTLPAGGSAVPITATDPSELVVYGPAKLFNSGQVEVSTEGTSGADGSVTSSSVINTISTDVGGQLSADSVTSECTADEAGVTGTTTIVNGVVDTVTNAEGIVSASMNIPPEPAVAFSIDGSIMLSANDTETFTFIFNEQTTSGGVLTVNAGHLVLHGPTAKGNLYFGQSVCGVNGTPTTTTTTSVSTTTTTVVAPSVNCDTITPTASTTAEAVPNSVEPGGSTIVGGGGFTPGETLDFTLCSTAVSLGTIAADAAGDFAATVTVPSDTAAGTHSVVVSSADLSRVATASITVVATGGGGGTTGGQGALSRTGTNSGALAGVAVIAVILGFAVVRAARYRRRVAPWER